MTFLERCAAEVASLHAAFEAWFGGDAGDEVMDRIREVLAPGFVLIGPTGAVLDRDRVLAEIDDGRGAVPMLIRVEDVQVTMLVEGIAIATYEEWHHRGDAASGRVSTAVLRDVPGIGPNGVQWCHVHETWVSR